MVEDVDDQDEKIIKNPMIGMVADEDAEIVFTLRGEDGERERFTYDSDPALDDAVLMMMSGLITMRRIKEVGFYQAIAELGLTKDLELKKGQEHPNGPGEFSLDNIDDTE